jgi:hypothetical protein
MSAGAAFAGMQIAGALLGGMEERGVRRAEARVHDENGRLSLLEGEQAAQLTRHDERQAAGAAIAAMAESGAALGTGTPLDLIRQSALEREIEIGNIRAQAAGEARTHRQAAADARYAGKAAMVRGIFDAVGAGVGYAADAGGAARLKAIGTRERASLQRQPASATEARLLGLPSSAWPQRPRMRVIGPPSN